MSNPTPGAKRYAVRPGNAGKTMPLTLPYAKALADTVALKAGAPVTLVSGSTGGNIVALGNPTISGLYMSEDRLLGFQSSMDAQTAVADYATDTGMAVPPTTRNSTFSNGGTEQIQVNIADGDSIFSMAMQSGIIGAASLIGTQAGFRLEDSQWVLDTASLYKQVVITGVNPRDMGKYGAQVDFDILPSVKQWPNPA